MQGLHAACRAQCLRVRANGEEPAGRPRLRGTTLICLAELLVQTCPRPSSAGAQHCCLLLTSCRRRGHVSCAAKAGFLCATCNTSVSEPRAQYSAAQIKRAQALGNSWSRHQQQLLSAVATAGVQGGCTGPALLQNTAATRTAPWCAPHACHSPVTRAGGRVHTPTRLTTFGCWMLAATDASLNRPASAAGGSSVGGSEAGPPPAASSCSSTLTATGRPDREAR